MNTNKKSCSDVVAPTDMMTGSERVKIPPQNLGNKGFQIHPDIPSFMNVNRKEGKMIKKTNQPEVFVVLKKAHDEEQQVGDKKQKSQQRKEDANSSSPQPNPHQMRGVPPILYVPSIVGEERHTRPGNVHCRHNSQHHPAPEEREIITIERPNVVPYPLFEEEHGDSHGENFKKLNVGMFEGKKDEIVSHEEGCERRRAVTPPSTTTTIGSPHLPSPEREWRTSYSPSASIWMPSPLYLRSAKNNVFLSLPCDDHHAADRTSANCALPSCYKNASQTKKCNPQQQREKYQKTHTSCTSANLSLIHGTVARQLRVPTPHPPPQKRSSTRKKNENDNTEKNTYNMSSSSRLDLLFPEESDSIQLQRRRIQKCCQRSRRTTIPVTTRRARAASDEKNKEQQVDRRAFCSHGGKLIPSSDIPTEVWVDTSRSCLYKE